MCCTINPFEHVLVQRGYLKLVHYSTQIFKTVRAIQSNVDGHCKDLLTIAAQADRTLNIVVGLRGVKFVSSQ